MFHKKDWGCSPAGGGGAVYGLGFVGALIYYLQHAPSVWDGLIGVLKAVVWPAFFVYKALDLWKF